MFEEFYSELKDTLHKLRVAAQTRELASSIDKLLTVVECLYKELKDEHNERHSE